MCNYAADWCIHTVYRHRFVEIVIRARVYEYAALSASEGMSLQQLILHLVASGDCSKRCRVGTLMGKRKKVYLIRPENLYIGAFRPENPYIGALQHNALKQELENLSRQWFVKFVDPDTGARRDGLLYPPKMNRKGVWEGKCLVEPLQEGREIGSTDPAQLVTVEPKHIEFDVERSGVSKSRRDIDDTASLGKGSKTTEFSELSRTPHISDGRPN